MLPYGLTNAIYQRGASAADTADPAWPFSGSTSKVR